MLPTKELDMFACLHFCIHFLKHETDTQTWPFIIQVSILDFILMTNVSLQYWPIGSILTPELTPVGINRKGFVTSNFGMFLLLDYCIENERGSIGMPLCRVLINISSKSSKIVYFSQNCHFHVMQCVCYQIDDVVVVLQNTHQFSASQQNYKVILSAPRS